MLETAFVVLAVMLAVHVLITAALLRRIRAIQERRAPAARVEPPLPALGAVEPFVAISTDGVELSHATLATGTTLVGFFMPRCGPCENARAQLLAHPPALPMLAFIEGSEDDPESRDIGTSLGPIARVAYTAGNDSVLRSFRPTSYPTFVRIEDGLVKRASHDVADVDLRA